MNLLTGVRCFSEGLSTAYSSGLRHFVLAPAAISLVVIISGLWIGFSYITDLTAYLIGQLPSWLSFLEWILSPLFYLIGILGGAWLFGFLATIIGSPFLGELAMRVDGAVDVDPVPWWKQILPALSRELRKLVYHLPRLAGVLLLSFIPVLNAFAPLLWLGFGGWMMSVQFCDFYTENRRQPFLDTLHVLRGQRAAALGFGICATLAMSIPILNFLFVPVAVVGGTRLMQQIHGAGHRLQEQP